ncbi:ribonuclease III [Cucumibacter marinus]|uniref:ribonuclease III n=1 Tax=Cucumibacter marinus TaxID=1121252 RepID=UPI00041F1B34|nr:ribonuclease III [Cucumibacter marinus]
MDTEIDSLAALEEAIGHRFADRALFEQALTHSSAVAPSRRTAKSYQRLEFLGDRVLGLVVAEALIRRFPKANEGDLSRSLNAVVRKESCAAVARELQLGEYLHLGDSEARSGGADKDAILGDVCEGLIGAIYLDAGIEPARRFVEKRFEQWLSIGLAQRGDAKTTLQEWAQSRGLEPPAYVEVSRSGPDHAPEFTIEIALEGFAPVRALGRSKKIAEHEAAEQFLVREKVWKKTS